MKLKPENTKSWNWGFFIGFIGTVVPFQLSIFYFENFLIAVFIGIICAMISIFAVAFFTYSRTSFELIE